MIVLVSCTNRLNALTKKVTQYYQQLLIAKEQKSQILDLGDLPKDFVYSALYENAGKNESFNDFQKIVDNNEKFVFIVPEYNGSFPGVLKAFIDGLRYPDSFKDKKIALIGISAGMQGSTLALSHLSDILSYLEADVLGLQVKMPFIQNYIQEDNIQHPPYNEFLEKQIDKFIHF